jgi:hypothetical protein
VRKAKSSERQRSKDPGCRDPLTPSSIEKVTAPHPCKLVDSLDYGVLPEILLKDGAPVETDVLLAAIRWF